jgi:sulfonate transport system permease protein
MFRREGPGAKRRTGWSLLGHPALLGSLPPLALVGLLHLASLQGASHAYAFVPLRQIAEGVLELLASCELAANLAATLGHMLSGLLIGGFAGLVLGGLMGISRPVELMVGPLYHTVRQVPLLGLIPLIGLWFGNGALSKVLIVSLAAFYPLVP